MMKGERGDAAQYAVLGTAAAVVVSVVGLVLSMTLGGSRQRRR